MDSVPDLAAQLLADTEFVSDLARYSEKLLTEKFIRRKYGNLTDDVWASLADNNELVEAIENEKLRRIRNGSAKRELAQKHIVKGPTVLSKIMDDESQNSRHRIDAVKALDSLAEPEPRKGIEQDRVIIRIDLTADAKLTSTEPNPNDIITIDVPRKTPTAITDETKDGWKKW